MIERRTDNAMLRNRYQDQTRRRARAPQDSQVRQLNRPATAGLTALQRLHPCFAGLTARQDNGTPPGVPRADEPFRLGTDELTYSVVESYERHKASAIVRPCQTTSSYRRKPYWLSVGRGEL